MWLYTLCQAHFEKDTSWNSPLKHLVGPCEAQHLGSMWLCLDFDKLWAKTQWLWDWWPILHQSSLWPRLRMSPTTGWSKLQSPTGPNKGAEKKDQWHLRQISSSWTNRTQCNLFPGCFKTTPSNCFIFTALSNAPSMTSCWIPVLDSLKSSSTCQMLPFFFLTHEANF